MTHHAGAPHAESTHTHRVRSADRQTDNVRRPVRLTAVAVAAALAIATVGTASAAAEEPSDSVEEVAAVLALAPPPTEGAAIEGERVPVAEIELPEDPSEGLALGALTVHLPGASAAEDAIALSGDTVVYADASPGVTVAAEQFNGGVRALIVIDSPAAQTRYDFPMSGAQTVSLLPDGGVAIVAQDGLVTIVPPAWAKDAYGASVPTHYEVNGTTITQVVDHVGAAYPVVADPEYTSGWVTWTVYFNRTETRDISRGSTLAAVCGFLRVCP
jgi:hypothetical protein